MNKFTSGIIGAVIGAVIVAAGFLGYVQLHQTGTDQVVGAASHANDVDAYFRSLATVGSFATTSQGTVTYTASSIQSASVILHNATAATTATLPASTTLATWLPKVGSRISIAVVNTGTGVLTLAGGTGTLLLTASSTKAINGGGVGLLEIVRKTNTDFAVFLSTAI